MPGKTMLTEDYIIRMISTVLVALTRIMGLKTSGQYQEAQVLIDQTLEELFGMRADLLRRLDDTTLIASLSVHDKPDAGRLAVAGRIYQEEGDILRAQRSLEEAYWSYARALSLSLEAALSDMPNDTALSEAVTTLVNALQGYTLPEDTNYSLFCYFEETGKFRQADNALKALAKSPEEIKAVMKERAEFYNRLLGKSDAELLQGGFTRLEVVEALNTILLHHGL